MLNLLQYSSPESAAYAQHLPPQIRRTATISLGIILAAQAIVTTSKIKSDILADFVEGRIKGWATGKRHRFVLQILLRTAQRYLSHLNAINLNCIVKLLTSMTIILTVLMIVASIYGRNVDLPFQERQYAFWIVTGIALGCRVSSVCLLEKRLVLTKDPHEAHEENLEVDCHGTGRVAGRPGTVLVVQLFASQSVTSGYVRGHGNMAPRQRRPPQLQY
ncbi:MAG TPA: CorA family divalent cation transporter [Anaerolineae bacterium]|nr:CorA family divalent cation transporter [Anaerolineae bacterium]